MHRLAAIASALIASPAFAKEGRTLEVSSWYAGGISYSQVVNNIINVLIVTIFYVSAGAFLLGAGMLILGFVNEENKSRGKNLMIGSLVGMTVALSAKAIFNTALYFVYGS